jgi:hypothetical protein
VPAVARRTDRQLVLALAFLVGAVLTAATLLLPYDVEVDAAPRAAVAGLSLLTAGALAVAPRLPDPALHAVLAAASGLIAWCTSQGAPGVEGVFFLIPTTYAFAIFPLRPAAAHLALAGALYAVVLATVPDERVLAPEAAWVLVLGVAALTGVTVNVLQRTVERERRAGARDRRIATELQRTLLPDALPEVPGVPLAARYSPAAREADVGGDLFDAVELEGGRLALVVGDVAGKGLAAAAAVGTLRTGVRAYAIEDAGPAEVLRRLDLLLAGTAAELPVATMVVAVVDLLAGDVRWASAGHLPPLVVGAGGARPLPGRPGPPLGAGATQPPPEHRSALASGEALVLLTDGAVERRGEPLDAGLRRVAAALGGVPAGAPPAQLVEAVVRAAGTPLADDLAVLAARLEAFGERFALDVPARPGAVVALRAALRRWLDGRADPGTARDVVLTAAELVTAAVRTGGGAPAHVGAARRADGSFELAVRGAGPWASDGLELARAAADVVEVRHGEAGDEVRARVGA